MRVSGKNIFLITGLVLTTVICGAFFSCAEQGIPIGDLRGQIQAGVKRKAELVFEARDPVVALVDNKKGALYAALGNGDIYKIGGPNKSERIYRGLSCCVTSWTAFAVTKEGALIANTCRNKKDVLVTIGDDGMVRDLATISERVLALAGDSAGRVYVAVWTSEGNVSISLNPRALAGAEYLAGKILELKADGSLVKLYEGGLPVWIAVSGKNILYASVWGRKGYFAPEKKEYGFADPYRAYWLALSDKIQFLNVAELKKRFENTMINSLSLFIIPEDDFIIGYGIAQDGTTGIFLVEEKRPPVKLLLDDMALEKDITCMTLFNNVLYFGNAAGKIYRIK